MDLKECMIKLKLDIQSSFLCRPKMERSANEGVIVPLPLTHATKPMLKWTPELHQLFLDTVARLGGLDEVSPKVMVRAMGIPGLTVFHLKSHLQRERYKRAKAQGLVHSRSLRNAMSNGDPWIQSMDAMGGIRRMRGAIFPPDENIRMEEEAIQKPISMKREMLQRIEVQKHLKLRMEAQTRYLQTVLERAKTALSSYNLDSSGVEAFRAELSELALSVVIHDYMDTAISKNKASEFASPQMENQRMTGMGASGYHAPKPQVNYGSGNSTLSSPKSPLTSLTMDVSMQGHNYELRFNKSCVELIPVMRGGPMVATNRASRSINGNNAVSLILQMGADRKEEGQEPPLGRKSVRMEECKRVKETDIGIRETDMEPPHVDQVSSVSFMKSVEPSDKLGNHENGGLKLVMGFDLNACCDPLIITIDK
ncbi:hypothetical protein AMTRI_Chr04g190440 [Amborella trichopoda]